MIRRFSPSLLSLVVLLGGSLNIFAQQAAPAAVRMPVVAFGEEPAVKAVFEANPRTPEKLWWAIDTLTQLRRPEMATAFIRMLTSAQLNADQLTRLADSAGADSLFRIAADTSQPLELRQLANNAIAAQQTYYQDVGRLHTWASQLGNPDLRTRDFARRALMRGGQHSVSHLVGVLSDANQAAAHPFASEILSSLEQEALPPLIGLLHEAPQPAVRQIAAQYIAQQGGLAAQEELYTASLAENSPITLPGVTPQNVQTVLNAATRRELDGAFDSSRTSHTEQTWTWNNQQGALVTANYRGDDRAMYQARRISTALQTVAPQDEMSVRMARLAFLDGATRQSGYDQPLDLSQNSPFAQALSWGPGNVSLTLSDAMSSGHFPAAVAACQILSVIGTPEMLYTGNSVSPLAAAANSYDARVRIAATRAILQINPPQGFPGSSAVPNSLALMATSRGVAKALIIHPRADLAEDWAGQLAELGYQSDIALNYQEAMARCNYATDYEIVFVHMALAIGAEEMLHRWRCDPRVAQIPIALIPHPQDIAGAELLAERLAAQDTVPQNAWQTLVHADHPTGQPLPNWRRLPPPLVMPPFPSRPQLAATLQQVTQLADRSRLPLQTRQQTADWSMQQMAAISQNPGPYDLRPHMPVVQQALGTSWGYQPATTIMANMGTHSSQQVLTQLASQQSLPTAQRQLAVDAFRQSVSRHGVQLTRPEVVAQYNRYNASEFEPRESQRLLSNVLNTLEGHR
jgi:hypothetical protein